MLMRMNGRGGEEVDGKQEDGGGDVEGGRWKRTSPGWLETVETEAGAVRLASQPAGGGLEAGGRIDGVAGGGLIIV